MPQPPIQRQPLIFYRVWCGRKRYSGWKSDIGEVWGIGIREGIAFAGLNDGPAGLGPLTWIEKGERKYSRSKTISRGRHV